VDIFIQPHGRYSPTRRGFGWRSLFDGFHVIGLLPSFVVTCDLVFSRYSRVSLVIYRNVCSTKHEASTVSLVAVVEAVEGGSVTDVAKFGRVLAPCPVRGAPYRPGLLVSPGIALPGHEQHNPRDGQGTWLQERPLHLLTRSCGTP